MAVTVKLNSPAPNNHPKAPFAQGDTLDAKFLELSWSLAAGQRQEFNTAGARAFYVDVATTTPGEMFFTLDDCFPFITFKQFFMFQLRPWNRLILRNASGVTQTGHLVWSANPEFLALQFTT